MYVKMKRIFAIFLELEPSDYFALGLKHFEVITIIEPWSSIYQISKYVLYNSVK